MPSIAYDPIRKLILDELVPRITSVDRDQIDQWLLRLERDKFDSRRLLICLCIDIKHHLVDLNILAGIIEKTVLQHLNYPDPIEYFYTLAARTSFDCLQYSDPDHTASRYAHVIRWGDDAMYGYFICISTGKNTFSRNRLTGDIPGDLS